MDGICVCDLDDVLLLDLWHQSQDGIFVVVCSVDSSTGRIIAGPDCISRGAILTTEEEHVYDEARERVLKFLEEIPEDGGRDWPAIRQDIRRTVNKLLQQKTNHQPKDKPVIMQI